MPRRPAGRRRGAAVRRSPPGSRRRWSGCRRRCTARRPSARRTRLPGRRRRPGGRDCPQSPVAPPRRRRRCRASAAGAARRGPDPGDPVAVEHHGRVAPDTERAFAAAAVVVGDQFADVVDQDAHGAVRSCSALIVACSSPRYVDGHVPPVGDDGPPVRDHVGDVGRGRRVDRPRPAPRRPCAVRRAARRPGRPGGPTAIVPASSQPSAVVPGRGRDQLGRGEPAAPLGWPAARPSRRRASPRTCRSPRGCRCRGSAARRRRPGRGPGRCRRPGPVRWSGRSRRRCRCRRAVLTSASVRWVACTAVVSGAEHAVPVEQLGGGAAVHGPALLVLGALLGEVHVQRAGVRSGPRGGARARRVPNGWPRRSGRAGRR